MADPYVYPGSTVLRNLPGLRDADALAEHEAQATTLRLARPVDAAARARAGQE